MLIADYEVIGPQGELYGRYKNRPTPAQVPLYAMVKEVQPGLTLGELPSEVASKKLLRGEPGAIPDLLWSTLERAFLISVPFFFLKIPPWKVAVGAMAASTVITLSVIGIVRSQEKAATPGA